jgi:hypothetical protein
VEDIRLNNAMEVCIQSGIDQLKYAITIQAITYKYRGKQEENLSREHIFGSESNAESSRYSIY